MGCEAASDAFGTGCAILPINMQRIHDIYRPTDERRTDWREVETMLSNTELKEQTSRCMNCGQPFCHAYGCPLGNLVPDQNRAVAGVHVAHLPRALRGFLRPRP